MTMHRIVFGLLFLSLSVLWPAATPAQALVESTRHTVATATTIKGSTTVIKDDKLKMQIQWNTAAQRYTIVTLADPEKGVFFAKRFSRQGTEPLANSPDLIAELRKTNRKVKIKGKNVDLSKPYVLRKKNDRYIVEAYSEPEELNQFFAILNQLLLYRAVPAINKTVIQPMTFKELEIGEGLMFKSRVKSFWK